MDNVGQLGDDFLFEAKPKKSTTVIQKNNSIIEIKLTGLKELIENVKNDVANQLETFKTDL